MDAAKLAAAIAAVKIATDVTKAAAPKLSGRWTQALVLALSIGGAFAVTGGGDALTIVGAVLTIFTGAVTADQVIKRKV